jgi:hypothetical protein
MMKNTDTSTTGKNGMGFIVHLYRESHDVFYPAGYRFARTQADLRSIEADLRSIEDNDYEVNAWHVSELADLESFDHSLGYLAEVHSVYD